MVAFGLIGVFIGCFIGIQFLTAQLRPYFRRFIEDHKDELLPNN